MAKNRLDPTLLEKLAKKIGKSEQYIREQISKKALANRVSSEAYFVHWLSNENMGSQRYRSTLDSNIQEDIRSLNNQGALSSNSIVNKKIIKKTEKIFQLPQLKVKAKPSILTQNLIGDARNNAEVYAVLFILENSLRNMVNAVMIKKHGPNWWKTKVHTDIQKVVNRRKQEEKMNPWRGTKVSDPIFYTDFADLAAIIKRNTPDFQPFFKDLVGKLNFLTQRLDELYGIRNNIAHTNPLKTKDKNMLLLYFQNFYDLLDHLNSKI